MTAAEPTSGAATIERPKGLLDQIAEEQERRKADIASRYMPTLSPKQFTERQKLMQELREMLVERVDYGVIPGTEKPTLLLPGAQKVCAYFGYVPKYADDSVIEDWSGAQNGEPLFYYRLTCVLEKDRNPVGGGIGSCNSWESKYRYRNAARKCPACGAESIIKGKEEYGGGWLCFAKKGGCGAKFPDGDAAIEAQSVGKVSNPDFADIVNTVLKMAKKRSYIDATLSATGLSQYFTQDVEDMRGAEDVDTGGAARNTTAAAKNVAARKLKGLTEKPTEPEIPAELQPYFAKLTATASTEAINDALNFIEGETVKALGQEQGDKEIARLYQKLGIDEQGATPTTTKAAMLGMWPLIEISRKSKAGKVA